MLLGVGVVLPSARRSRRAAATMVAAALIAVPGAAVAASSAWSDHDVVAVRLVAAAPAADGSPRLGLHFRLAPEWHVYWRHPGDAGAPPQVAITFTAPGDDRDAVEPQVLFPAPRRFRLPGGLEALGYDGEVVYPLRLAAAPPAASGLTAAVDYVACAIECIPFHDDLEAGGAARRGRRARAGRRADAALGGAAAAAGQRDRRRGSVALPRRRRAGARARAGAAARRAPAIGDSGSAATTSGGSDHAGDATGGGPELFLEPAPGATFDSPERIDDGAGIRFRAAVRPEVAGQPPRELRVAWTVTGVAIGASVAVAGVATVPAGGEVGSGADRSPKAGSETTSTRTSESGRRLPAAALVALFALVPLLAALALWFLPASIGSVPPAALRILGFVVATGLVWSAYRLAALLPTVRIAAVELLWLTVALAVRCATTTAGARRRVWLALALAAAAAGVWAAWPPAMISP